MVQPVPACDLLIFVTTESEVEALRLECDALGLSCFPQDDPELGAYFDLGIVGGQRVVAVRTRMGTVEHRAAAFQAALFQSKTGATGLIATGMAFGISPELQRIGEVLVAESLFPYDQREIVDSPVGPVPDYTRTKRRAANRDLVSMIAQEVRRSAFPFRVSTGLLLSGGARISSRSFRDSLVAAVPPGREPVIGGDMEGVGLLSVSHARDPRWVVVKGISDFAEGGAGSTKPAVRLAACRNAIGLVLSAILHRQ